MNPRFRMTMNPLIIIAVREILDKQNINRHHDFLGDTHAPLLCVYKVCLCNSRSFILFMLSFCRFDQYMFKHTFFTLSYTHTNSWIIITVYMITVPWGSGEVRGPGLGAVNPSVLLQGYAVMLLHTDSTDLFWPPGGPLIVSHAPHTWKQQGSYQHCWQSLHENTIYHYFH